MFPQATILLYKEETPEDLHLARLTEFWGVQWRMVRLDLANELDKILSGREILPCLMVSAGSLGAILQDRAIPPEFVGRLFERSPFVFVWGVTSGEREILAVRHLTDGLVSTVCGFDRSDHQYHVSSLKPEMTEEFSGLAFGPINKECDFGLHLNRPPTGFSEIVTIGGLSQFASFKKQNSSIFLLACREIVDLQTQSKGSLSAHEYFSRVVPVLMFLRHVFGDQTWHNPKRCASFIIDDPLLRKSYGFLNYSRLLAEMDSREFTASIAFIPWNHKRTHPDVAKLMRERSDRFTVCVHGCDHTEAEFASMDVRELNTRIHLASQRMKAHERRTGVPYAEIMVFPQGEFSSVSLGVLKGHNYLAAVNTSIIPQDFPHAHGLTIAELLAPAISRYSSFPLFMRRYPRNLADFAFDLFVGKPALVVEHHGYFRQGYEKIREFTTQLNSLSPKLRWMGLGELVRHTYLQRSVSPDTVECRIFANRQILDNPAPRGKSFIIYKPEGNEIPIGEVAVNGKQHPYFAEHDHMRLCVDVPASSETEVTIKYGPTAQYASNSEGQSFRQQAQVYLRRYLSTVRDNYLSKHDKLLSLAYRLKEGRLFG